MPWNDLSDARSVRAPDDPRNPLKALQQEVEQELGNAEAGDTGGVEHQTPQEREARPAHAQRGRGTPGAGELEEG